MPIAITTQAFSVFRFAVCGLLGFAAYHKLAYSQSAFSIALACVEFTVCSVLFLDRKSPYVSLLAAVLFGGFASAAFLKVLSGVSSCGCFGDEIQASPVVVAILDLGICLLFIGEFRSRRSFAVRAYSPRAEQFRDVLFALVAGCVAVIGVLWIAERGPVVATVDSELDERSGYVTVNCTLWNSRPYPVRIESVLTSCSCISSPLDKLPVYIQANSDLSLEFLVRLGEGGDLPQDQELQFFVKEKYLSRLRVPLRFSLGGI